MVRNLTREVERGRSREKIITLLLEKPYTFTELYDLTGFSRSTLTGHLKVLQKDIMIEKKLDETDRVVYRLTLDSDKLEQEMMYFALETVMAYLNKYQPKIGLLMMLVIKASLKTRMQYETSKYTWEAQSPKDLTVFLRNLDESVTPEDAEILDLPDGRKISDYFAQYFKGKGGV
jgi:DNA-binding transcriptional ArsR family regulator